MRENEEIMKLLTLLFLMLVHFFFFFFIMRDGEVEKKLTFHCVQVVFDHQVKLKIDDEEEVIGSNGLWLFT